MLHLTSARSGRANHHLARGWSSPLKALTGKGSNPKDGAVVTSWLHEGRQNPFGAAAVMPISFEPDSGQEEA
jgi:hypothetical protein